MLAACAQLHNACCMRAIRSLQAFCKLWQAFYRAHIFIREELSNDSVRKILEFLIDVYM